MSCWTCATSRKTPLHILLINFSITLNFSTLNTVTSQTTSEINMAFVDNSYRGVQNIPSSLTFRGSKLVILTTTVTLKGLGRECLSDVTSGSRISCKIVNIVFYMMRRAKIAFELHFFKILAAFCLNRGSKNVFKLYWFDRRPKWIGK